MNAPRHIKQCAVCEKQFTSRRKDAVTCSENCRSRLKYWRKVVTNDAKAAIRTLFTLRCAVVRGNFPAAGEWIAKIEAALDNEKATLKARGIALPTLLPINQSDEKSCPPNDAAMRRLRQELQAATSPRSA